ncbi:putative ABC transporter ATP-binding protein [compost metagenome]
MIPKLFTIPHFQVKSGEKILIQGPSGRGKTTLLHLIGGLLKPTQGQVLVDNQDIPLLSDHDLSAFRRHKIGFVFQKLNLVEHMTVLENLSLVMHGTSPEQALEILKRVGLTDKAHVWTSKLSLGEQQRVAVARLLLQQPDLLLADEPTSSLDEDNAKAVIDLLFEAAQGKTLIVVSHDKRLHERFDRSIPIEELFQ